MNASALLNDTIAFIAEDEAAALARYTGFASNFFAHLYSALPSLRGSFRFFRDPETNDLWSVCEISPRPFGLQLDPDIEVICLWDASYHEEIGYWPPQLSNPVAYAIDKIRERYIPAR